MSNTPIGRGPKAAPPTPPATPSATPKRGWETTPSRSTAPLTPPTTPPIDLASQHVRAASSNPYPASTAHASFTLQRPSASSQPGAPITVDAAGHKPLHRKVLRTLSPAERNMHDHWYGRSDRNFHSHAKEFETLADPITSWQDYMALAKSVVAQKNKATTTSFTLEHGKTGIYDSARNLFVVCAPQDAHIITMYRPGLNMLPDNQRPKVLAPLAQGQRYIAKFR